MKSTAALMSSGNCSLSALAQQQNNKALVTEKNEAYIRMILVHTRLEFETNIWKGRVSQEIRIVFWSDGGILFENWPAPIYSYIKVFGCQREARLLLLFTYLIYTYSLLWKGKKKNLCVKLKGVSHSFVHL